MHEMDQRSLGLFCHQDGELGHVQMGKDNICPSVGIHALARLTANTLHSLIGIRSANFIILIVVQHAPNMVATAYQELVNVVCDILAAAVMHRGIKVE